MRGRERAVKWLDPKRGRVRLEARGRHHRHGPETPNVAVVQRSPVVERERDGRISALVRRETPVVDEQGPGKARLYDEPFARRK